MLGGFGVFDLVFGVGLLCWCVLFMVYTGLGGFGCVWGCLVCCLLFWVGWVLVWLFCWFGCFAVLRWVVLHTNFFYLLLPGICWWFGLFGFCVCVVGGDWVLCWHGLWISVLGLVMLFICWVCFVFMVVGLVGFLGFVSCLFVGDLILWFVVYMLVLGWWLLLFVVC